MATLADELLNDFDDSGSDNEEHENGPQEGNEERNGGGDRVGDESDESMHDEFGDLGVTVDDGDDAAETQRKVEKMKLGGIRDVRSVANLMKTLDPILEVSLFL